MARCWIFRDYLENGRNVIREWLDDLPGGAGAAIDIFILQGEVTLLVGAEERGGKFVPRSACATAQDRKQYIEGEGQTCEHE